MSPLSTLCIRAKSRGPHPLREITYSEMRDILCRLRFSMRSPEPDYRNDIPVMIRNTNQPEIKGTKIVSKKELDPRYPVTGVSSATGFTAISISKYLLTGKWTSCAAPFVFEGSRRAS